MNKLNHLPLISLPPPLYFPLCFPHLFTLNISYCFTLWYYYSLSLSLPTFSHPFLLSLSFSTLSSFSFYSFFFTYSMLYSTDLSVSEIYIHAYIHTYIHTHTHTHTHTHIYESHSINKVNFS